MAGIGSGEHDHRVDADGDRVEDARSRLSPSSSAFSRAISRTAAAPSEICEELPAVTLPPSLKAGLSAASASRLVSRRIPWSAEMDLAVDAHRDHLALESTLVGRAGGELVRAQAKLVLLGAGDLPALGDQLGREALWNQVIARHELGG